MVLRGCSHVLRGAIYSLTFSIIILQLIFLPCVLKAADGNPTPHFNQKDYSIFNPENLGLNGSDFLKSANQFTPDEKIFIEKYFNEPARVTLDLMIIAKALAEKIHELESQKTPSEISEQIKRRNQDAEIKVEVPGIGKAEFNSFGLKENGRIFTRFVHYGTQKSYLFIDTDIIKLNIDADGKIDSIKEITPEEIQILEQNELTAELKERTDIWNRKIAKKLNPGPKPVLSTEDIHYLKARAVTNEKRRRVELKGELERFIAIQRMHTPAHREEYNPFPDITQMDPDQTKEMLRQLIDDAKKSTVKKKYDDHDKKIEKGRDTTVVFYSGKNHLISTVNNYDNYRKLSPSDKVKLYWASIKQGTRLNWEYWDNTTGAARLKTFLTGDAFVANFSAIMQTGIYVGTNWMINHSFNPLGAILVAVWGFGIGITPTFRNFININPNPQVILFKSFLNSVIFNYALTIGMYGANVVFSLSEKAANINWTNVTNAVINNFGKIWYTIIPQSRQRAGLSLYEMNFKWLRTRVDKSSFEQQYWYLGSNVFRTMDLISTSALFSFLMMDFTWSRLSLLLSIPAMHYAVMKYAEKKDFREKKDLRQKWENANFLPVGKFKLPLFYTRFYAHYIFKDTWAIVKNSAIGVMWISKMTFDTLVYGAKETTIRLFSYKNTPEDNNNPLVCKSLFY